MLTIQQIKENPQYVIDRLKVKGFDGKEKIEKYLRSTTAAARSSFRPTLSPPASTSRPPKSAS